MQEKGAFVPTYPRTVDCMLCDASGQVYVTYELVCHEFCGGQTECRDEPRYEAFNAALDNVPAVLQSEAEPCSTCGGQGTIAGKRHPAACPDCEGRGTQLVERVPPIEDCPRCDRKGNKLVDSLREERRFLGLDVATGLSPEEAQALHQKA